METLPPELLALILEECLTGAPMKLLDTVSRVCYRWRDLVFRIPLRVRGRALVTLLERFPDLPAFEGCLIMGERYEEAPEKEWEPWFNLLSQNFTRVLQWISRVHLELPDENFESQIRELLQRCSDIRLDILCECEGLYIRYSREYRHPEYEERGYLKIKGGPDGSLETERLGPFLDPFLELGPLCTCVLEGNLFVQEEVLEKLQPRIVFLSEGGGELDTLPSSIREIHMLPFSGKGLGYPSFRERYDEGRVYPHVTRLRALICCNALQEMSTMFPGVREWDVEHDPNERIPCSQMELITRFRRQGHRVRIQIEPPTSKEFFDLEHQDIIQRIVRHLPLRDLRAFCWACEWRDEVTELAGEGVGSIIPLPYLRVFPRVTSLNGYLEIRRCEDLLLIQEFLCNFGARLSRTPRHYLLKPGHRPVLRQLFLQVRWEEELVTRLVWLLINELPKVHVESTSRALIIFPGEPKAHISYDSKKNGYNLVLPSRFLEWRAAWNRSQVSDSRSSDITGRDGVSFAFFY